jgi:chromosome segregation ATPase
MNQKVINQLVVDTYNLHFPRIEKELTKLAKLILEIKNNRPTPGGDIDIDSEIINEINWRLDELNSMLDSVSSNVDNISTDLSNYSAELSNYSSNVDTIISENESRDLNISNLENRTIDNEREITYAKNSLSNLMDQVNNYDIDSMKYDVLNNANSISSLESNLQNNTNEFIEFKTAYNQHVLDQSASNVTFSQHVHDVSAIQLVVNVDDGEYFNTEVVEDNVELNHNELIQSLCFKVNGLIRNSIVLVKFTHFGLD